MSLPQQTVFLQQSAGFVGDLYGDFPFSADPYELDSVDETNNVFGNFFTVTSQGIAQAGGTGPVAGFMVDPKDSALRSTGGLNPFTPTLQLPNGSIAAMLTIGKIFVTLPAPCNIGDWVIYDLTTGELATVAPPGPIPVGFGFAYATVDLFTPSSAGLAVIRVNYSQQPV